MAPSTEALQLLGLSLVEQKEYTEALEVFQRLPLGEDTWNSQVHKASLLCYKYIARQQKEKSFP